jgi:uncharacterized membrane protein YdbT with pleckstrin-like domain
MRCTQCGVEAPQGATFCARCGTRMNTVKPAAQREYALMRVWPSWWKFTRPFVFATILAGAGAYVFMLPREDWRFAPIAWAGAAALILLAFVARRATSWSLSSERLIERRGIFFTRQRQLELVDIRSVEIDRRFLQKLMGIGDVTVASAASADFAIRMTSVHDPERTAETIRQARLKRLA